MKMCVFPAADRAAGNFCVLGEVWDAALLCEKRLLLWAAFAARDEGFIGLHGATFYAIICVLHKHEN